MSSPTELIAGRAGKIFNIIDDNGRELKIRRIDALDRLRLLKAAGPELARNDAWLNMAALAFAVVEIERTPRISPATERQIETIVSELGDSGISAVAAFLNADEESASITSGELMGNGAGASN